MGAPETHFLLATRSTHKAREIAAILRPLGIECLSLDDIGLPATDEEEIEQFDTFAGNACAKAEHFGRLCDLPALADDSGLVVHALGGWPGVRSRRFSGRLDLHGDALDRANNDTLLGVLAGTTTERRDAHYVCVASLWRPACPPASAVGTVRGRILESPRGHGGFGYDPLFLVSALGRTFAECDAATKHTMSHRGRAFRALTAVRCTA